MRTTWYHSRQAPGTAEFILLPLDPKMKHEIFNTGQGLARSGWLGEARRESARENPVGLPGSPDQEVEGFEVVRAGLRFLLFVSIEGADGIIWVGIWVA